MASLFKKHAVLLTSALVIASPASASRTVMGDEKPLPRFCSWVDVSDKGNADLKLPEGMRGTITGFHFFKKVCAF